MAPSPWASLKIINLSLMLVATVEIIALLVLIRYATDANDMLLDQRRGARGAEMSRLVDLVGSDVHRGTAAFLIAYVRAADIHVYTSSEIVKELRSMYGVQYDMYRVDPMDKNAIVGDVSAVTIDKIELYRLFGNVRIYKNDSSTIINVHGLSEPLLRLLKDGMVLGHALKPIGVAMDNMAVVDTRQLAYAIDSTG